jgi:hypothetical protein
MRYPRHQGCDVDEHEFPIIEIQVIGFTMIAHVATEQANS